MNSIVNKVILGAMITGSTLGLNGCKNKPYDLTEASRDIKIQGYLSSSPANIYEDAKASWRKDGLRALDMQSTLDSLAYGDVFKATEASKDSVLTKKFSKIAKLTKAPMNIEYYTDMTDRFYQKFKKTLNLKQYQELKDRINGCDSVYTSGRSILTSPEISKRMSILQAKTDSIAYSEFFSKNHLFKDGNVIKKFIEASRKVRP